ncbi:TlpA family protein disulfide reductase [Prolixibacteraceae bacterium JC049]|nr:TlpA family protein disulfide reductase [Prolixibacteraceae bacterium JC049]
MKTFLLMVLMSVGMVGVSNAQGGHKASGDRGYIVKVGDKMPDFSMKLTDGKTVTLADLKGKVVMLQFTASWCGVCRKEMPFIEKEIWQKYKDRNDFALYGIDRDEPLKTVVKFGKQVGVTYPLALDPGADIFGLVAQKKAGITRNVILDKDGTIVYLTRLFNREEFDAMKAKIASLMK